jgi:hypothetical protein
MGHPRGEYPVDEGQTLAGLMNFSSSSLVLALERTGGFEHEEEGRGRADSKMLAQLKIANYQLLIFN